MLPAAVAVLCGVTSALRLRQDPATSGDKALEDVLDSLKSIPDAVSGGKDNAPVNPNAAKANVTTPNEADGARTRAADATSKKGWTDYYAGQAKAESEAAARQEAIAELEAAKKAAVDREDFKEAERLKSELHKFKAAAESDRLSAQLRRVKAEAEAAARQEAIARLEAAKKAAIEKEDYSEADRLNRELHKIKAGVNETVASGASVAAEASEEAKDAVPITSHGQKEEAKGDASAEAYDVQKLDPSHPSAGAVKEAEKRVKEAKEVLDSVGR